MCPGSFVLFHVHGFHNHNTSARHPLEEREATSNFLWTSSETQTSNPDSSRGRKRIWTHNKNYVPSCANSCLSRRTFKAKTFVEGTKKEMEIILALGNLCDVQNHSYCLPERTVNQPDHFPSLKVTNAGCSHLPQHITAAPRCCCCSEKLKTEPQGLIPRKKPV